MKKNIAVILAFVMLLSLAACTVIGKNSGEKSGIKTGNSGKSDSAKAGKSGLRIDDIVWTAEEGIVSGDRVLILTVTNNSKYVVKNEDRFNNRIRKANEKNKKGLR